MTDERPAEQPAATELITDVLWQRQAQTSLEHCRISRLPGMYVMQGIVLGRSDEAPLQVHYVVACGMDWVTRSAHVTIIEGVDVRRVQLDRDEQGVWRSDDGVLPEFEGLADVDVQITPATNTLPIRRLRLDVGETADMDALWIRVPELRLERLPQRYARIGEQRYRYESRGGAFRAELDVDHEGVVVRYGDVWRRV